MKRMFTVMLLAMVLAGFRGGLQIDGGFLLDNSGSFLTDGSGNRIMARPG